MKQFPEFPPPPIEKLKQQQLTKLGLLRKLNTYRYTKLKHSDRVSESKLEIAVALDRTPGNSGNYFMSLHDKGFKIEVYIG